MSEQTITCPKCGSDDIFVRGTICMCGACGHRFDVEEPQEGLETRAPEPLRIFISYGHAEEEIVRRIKEHLEARGHEVWFDASEIKVGDEWREKIAEGVASSNGVIACLSKHAFRDGGVCHDEIDIAIGVRGGNIKTVLLDPESEVKPPSAITHIQWLDMALWRQKLETGPAEFDPWFQACMSELVRVVESKESLQFQGEITRISDCLTVLADNSRRSYLLSRPFQGREWLAEQVASWVQSRETPRVCLITGDAGVGKSAFAAHLSHWGWKLYGRVAASFFCEAGRELYNDPRTVVQTLAYLLACRIPQYRTLLATTLEYRRDFDAMNADDLFALLIGDPLSHAIDGGHECMLMVVDGLDEAGDAEHNPLAETLARYAERLPAWMKVLVTSRRVSAATAPFGTGVELIDLSSSSESNMADVHAFLVSRLEGALGADPGFEQAVSTLAQASGGIFLYANLMADAILKDNVTLKDAAATCPRGLSEMFYQWFRWTFPDLREYRKVFRLALGCVAAAPGGALPVEELSELFSWGGNELNDFLRRVEVFLRHVDIEGLPAIALSHTFIAQWLQSPEAGAYQSLPQDALVLMGKAWFETFRKRAGFNEQRSNYQTAYLLDVLCSPGLEKENELYWNCDGFSTLHTLQKHLFDEKRKARRLIDAANMARGLLRHYCKHPTQHQDYRAYWTQKLAGLCTALHAYSEAEELYIDLVSQAKRDLDGKEGTYDQRQRVGDALDSLGSLQLDMGKGAQAEETLRDALSWLGLDGQGGLMRVNTIRRLARAYEMQGMLVEAEAEYAHAICRCKELLNQTRYDPHRAKLQKALSNALTAYGNLLTGQGRTDEAKVCFDWAASSSENMYSEQQNKAQELAIRLRLKADDSSISWPGRDARDELRAAILRDVDPYWVGRLQPSVQSALEKFDEFRASVGIQKSAHLRRRAANTAMTCCLRVAQCYAAIGDFAHAEQYYLETLNTLSSICEEEARDAIAGPYSHEALDYRGNLLTSVIAYAFGLDGAGRSEEILHLFKAYLPDYDLYDPQGITDALAQRDASRNLWIYEVFCPTLMRYLLLYAGYLADAGKQLEAQRAYRQAYALEDHTEFGNARSDFSSGASEMINAAKRTAAAGNVAAAEKIACDSLAVRHHLAEKDPRMYLPQLAVAHQDMAMLLNNYFHRYEEAAEHAREALKIREQLAQDEPERYLPLVAESYVSLGIEQINSKRYEQAASSYDAAASVYRKLFEKEPEAYRFRLEDALSRQRIALARAGREDAAQAVFQEEIDLVSDLAGKASEIDLDSLAFGYMAQLVVDMYLVEEGRYNRIDFKRRDQAIVELDKALEKAALNHLGSTQFDELNAILSADDFSAEAYQEFVLRTGLAEVQVKTWQAFLAQFDWTPSRY